MKISHSRIPNDHLEAEPGLSRAQLRPCSWASDRSFFGSLVQLRAQGYVTLGQHFAFSVG